MNRIWIYNTETQNISELSIRLYYPTRMRTILPSSAAKIGLMKGISYLLFCCLILFVWGCGAPMQKELQDESDNLGLYGADSVYINNQLSVGLENDSIPYENLDVFETRAIQKLQDFGEYITLLSDTSIDRSFREQAFIMVQALFESEKSNISFDDKGNVIKESQPISHFIKKIYQHPLEKLELHADSIHIAEKLHNRNNEVIGLMQCLLSVNQKQPYTIHVVIKLKRVEKQFGSSSKMVWEILLGDIY